MKNLSLILNILLVVAVGVLFYLQFSSHKKCGVRIIRSATGDSCATIPPAVVAYVEMDSLNNSVDFIKGKRTELENEQKVIMSEYENAYRGLEAEKNNFLQKGDAITQQEAQAFQEKLMYKQQDIENSKQAKGQKLAEKGAKMMEELQGTLKEFLAEYNKDKKYTYIFATGNGLDYLFYKDSALNITPEIIKGLNAKMKSDKK